MNMYTHVCVCMYVRMKTYTYIQTYMYTHIAVSLSLYIYWAVKKVYSASTSQHPEPRPLRTRACRPKANKT